MPAHTPWRLVRASAATLAALCAGALLCAVPAQAATGAVEFLDENDAGGVVGSNTQLFTGGGGCRNVPVVAGETQALVSNLTTKPVTVFLGSNCGPGLQGPTLSSFSNALIRIGTAQVSVAAAPGV